MSILYKFTNLILYGNFWIALGSLSLLWQTTLIYQQEIYLDPLTGFVFAGTLFLYALHRIVGISKSHAYFQLERYTVITQYKSHIQIYAGVGAIVATGCFFLLNRSTQLSIIIPGLLSLGYVLPILGNKKRLRDLNDIKIFLVALVWAWITVLLPALAYDLAPTKGIMLSFIERFLFIFAITLPFDIRDLKVDEQSAVRTLPAKWGVNRTKQISIGMLMVALGINLYCWQAFYYSIPIMAALSITYLTTMVLIKKTTPERSDYFYTGLMDGTMVLSGFLVGIVVYLFQ